MADEFERDNDWQKRVAARLLDPFYRSRGYKVERFGDHHPMQGKHVDVVITRPDVGHRKGVRYLLDEKILRARDDGEAAAIVTLETWSCTVSGHEKRGWFHRDEEALATVLMFCFADAGGYDDGAADRVTVLDCVWMPFVPLKAWFHDPELGGEERFPVYDGNQINHSLSRKVTIEEVLRAGLAARRFPIPLVAGKVFMDEEGRFIHYCRCGAQSGFGDGVSLKDGQLGTWWCRDCLPKGYLPS